MDIRPDDAEKAPPLNRAPATPTSKEIHPPAPSDAQAPSRRPTPPAASA